MKKLLCASLVALSVVASGAAFGAPSTAAKAKKNGFYVRGDAGVGFYNSIFTNNKIKVGPVVGAGVGYKFNDMFRADVSGQYRNIIFQSGPSKVNLSTYALLLNGYLDIQNNTKFTPYLVAGLGVAYATVDINGSRVTKKGKTTVPLPWNIGLGVRTKLTDDLDADLGYRYTKISNTSFLNERSNILASHQVTLGVAYNF
jgi:opacity protein-like surface antigen